MSKKRIFSDRIYLLYPALSLVVDLAMFFLALATLLLFLHEAINQPPLAELLFLLWVDTIICGVFIVEYVIRSFLSGSWRNYFRAHWYDLLGSIPIPLTSWGPLRALRLLRLLRLLTIANRLRKAHRTAKRIKGANVLAYTAIVAGSIIFLCAMLVFWLESPVNPSFDNFFDAIWWAMATVTTVGYGDAVPITEAGRVVGIALMITSIGLISTIAASMASIIIGSLPSEKDQGEDGRDLTAQLERLAALRERGQLSGHEFEAAKRRLLSSAPDDGAGEHARAGKPS